MLAVFPNPKPVERFRYAEIEPRRPYPRVLLPDLFKERPRVGVTYRVTAVNDGTPFRYHLVAKSSTEAMILAKELLPTSKLVSVDQEGEW